MTECNKCKQTIRGEMGIQCMGVCEKVFHTASKCCGIDQYSSRILEGNNYVRFVCDDCMQYIHNVDMVLKDIQEEVRKNKQGLIDYKDEFVLSLKKNEDEIKKLLESVEKTYEEKRKKMMLYQKCCEDSVKEIKKLFGEVENTNTKLCKEIEEKNVNMCNEIKKIITETNKKQNKTTYADSVKNKKVVPEIRKQAPLIIKPKEKQTIEKTKEELNKINPINLKIKNVENRKNGTIIIQSENSEERDKIKNAVEEKLTEKYEIKVPRPVDLKIKIVDMTFKYEDKEIVEKLKKQNQCIESAEIKIINKYETTKKNKTTYNAILNVDSDSYKKIIEERKLNIGWERCRVFDGTDVVRCMKCRGYNHIARECRNMEVCLRCHEQHRTKDCKSKEVLMKCINCIKMNEKLNMGLEVNHHTNDRDCPVYQNKLNAKMRRFGIET